MVSKNGPMLCTYWCNLENGVQVRWNGVQKWWKWPFLNTGRMVTRNGHFFFPDKIHEIVDLLSLAREHISLRVTPRQKAPTLVCMLFPSTLQNPYLELEWSGSPIPLQECPSICCVHPWEDCSTEYIHLAWRECRTKAITMRYKMQDIKNARATYPPCINWAMPHTPLYSSSVSSICRVGHKHYVRPYSSLPEHIFQGKRAASHVSCIRSSQTGFLRSGNFPLSLSWRWTSRARCSTKRSAIITSWCKQVCRPWLS